ncbi:MAG TPA: FKBP-type peptidyl-prolyl cis-trans isomerase [Bacteroidales bacterium]|nr:peptidylprolyl isomerase [Bacteroidales bacterium]HOU95804.1 FKBP-type peptidyl-prolyl cis-trans isomerase [Bacteroidales bacterium]HQG36589.1 FKBP-type peptidyl-prolyl cis-trans isomerase [Bacteroidales bacterium]HQG52906.1 FKBP-type peptidyl-prolyl cis-trans isomerase [Bacteroidales bacterium]HQJ21284.1 FKBP-type peptidyl-prolyl cis-trans isomerase [Bacteroidales bacterium]
MKIKQLLILLAVSAVFLSSCGEKAITGTRLKTYEDTISYAFGINIYYSLISDSIILNPSAIARAMYDASNNKQFMDDNIARTYILAYLNKIEEERTSKQEEINKEIYKQNIFSGDSFLQANRTKEGVVITESGLQYKIIKLGSGPKPDENDIVKVHYKGTFINGKVFDSSYDRGTPVEFQLNKVIKGWAEALPLMPEGSKFIIYVPESLAYGAAGVGSVIEPYTTLIFEVELLQVIKQD